VWPNARVTLKNLATKTEVSTVSSGPGSHNFSGVLYGECEVTVTLVGFDPYPKRVTIRSDEASQTK
jgi:hypothetical protein